LRAGDFVLRLIKYLFEVRRSQKPQLFAKTFAGHMRPGSEPSGRQFSAASCTTTLDNQTTTAGGHASTKTVTASTLQNAGLKSSFHNGLPGNSVNWFGKSKSANFIGIDVALQVTCCKNSAFLPDYSSGLLYPV